MKIRMDYTDMVAKNAHIDLWNDIGLNEENMNKESTLRQHMLNVERSIQQSDNIFITKKKKRPIIKCGKNTVLYSSIYEASKFINDDFWKGLFEELSYGKHPKCVYISNNTLFSANKKKPFSFPLNQEDKNPEELAEELHQVLLNNTTLCSIIDNNEKKAQVQANKISIVNNTKWSSIKKKNLRAQYIRTYVLNMKRRYKLTDKATKHLLTTIHNAFEFKTHASDDVVFNENEIKSIKDIVYDNFYKLFINIREFDPDIDWADDVMKDKNYIHYHWPKYVITMSKAVEYNV